MGGPYVLRDSPQSAAEAGAPQSPSREGRKSNPDRDHEHAANLERRAPDMDDAPRSDPPKGKGIRKDVARAREDRVEHRLRGEGDGHDAADPADRRAAGQERPDCQAVGRGPCDDTHGKRRGERQREPAAPEAGLRDRASARSDGEREKDADPDQVTEGEIDDSRQPEDQRVPDGDHAVDGTGGDPREEDLKRQAHRAEVKAVLRRARGRDRTPEPKPHELLLAARGVDYAPDRLGVGV